MKKILAINPGSTSTEIGLAEGEELIFVDKIEHSQEELIKEPDVFEQYNMRFKAIMSSLEFNKINLNDIHAIAARGGRLRPLESGTYKVNQKMLHDCRIGLQGDHPSNLACHIAQEIASSQNIPAFIVDPITVDELSPIARISGFPTIERTSLSHALNMKAVAKKYCEEHEMNYEDRSIIVAHVGGGGSVSLHLQGKMIDLYNSDKEGAFSVERAGGLPTLELVEICFSEQRSANEFKKILAGEGGLFAYLQTRNMKKVEKMIDKGNEKAEIVLKAMAYQFAKSIGALATVNEGKNDAIIITGGVARSEKFLSYLLPRIKFLAPLKVYPGGYEMEALVKGVLEVLTGKKEIKEY